MPPYRLRSVTKLGPKRYRSERLLTKDLDSKVGFREWLVGIPLILEPHLPASRTEGQATEGSTAFAHSCAPSIRVGGGRDHHNGKPDPSFCC